MFPPTLISNSSFTPRAIALPVRRLFLFKPCAHLRQLRILSASRPPTSTVISDSLRLLEWDKVCDAVASFAGTPLGRDATKKQLWEVDVGYEESRRHLSETEAAVEMIKYGLGGLDFAGLDLLLVKSAVDRAPKGLPIDGLEAMAVVSFIQFAENLQINLKAAVKEDMDWYNRFMPLSQVIMDIIISRQFVKSVQQVILEDGSVKDSASSELKRSRDQVKLLEKKLSQLMDKLVRNEKVEASSLEICTINGRWCLKTNAIESTTFDALLMSRYYTFIEHLNYCQISNQQIVVNNFPGVGGLLEPIAAVPLNDELQQARASVAKAEDDVLSKLTDKMVAELDGILNSLCTIIWLDAVTARAKYSIAYGGSYPELYFPGDKERVLIEEGNSSVNSIHTVALSSPLPQRERKLHMPKAYHPLLLKQHHENLHKARQELANATAEIRRRKLQGKVQVNEDAELTSMKIRVAALEKGHPTPIDFMVSMRTGVLVITGPNTGGKTISLKTVGVASLMAKTGLYVLASEPVKIPWFDAIYVDIGDEQSLTQSLSTFSGHLRQISAIRSQSSNKSLVLLDEVGAGTNPLEGAALGMSLLESFAENGSFLTIATTHHGELKTLKYSNSAFENACVEFDEESLKPTFKILWGVPGRSNAINIAKRLGLPSVVLDNASKLHGAASAEINGVIIDMERYKHNYQEALQEAQHYLMLSRKLYEDMLIAKQKIDAHSVNQRNKKVRAILDTAAVARSVLRIKLQQFRESVATQERRQNGPEGDSRSSTTNFEQSPSASIPVEKAQTFDTSKVAHKRKIKIPEVGDMVLVPSLGKQAIVLKVETSKKELLVQASNMKLRLKFDDIEIQQVRMT